MLLSYISNLLWFTDLFLRLYPSYDFLSSKLFILTFYGFKYDPIFQDWRKQPCPFIEKKPGPGTTIILALALSSPISRKQLFRKDRDISFLHPFILISLTSSNAAKEISSLRSRLIISACNIIRYNLTLRVIAVNEGYLKLRSWWQAFGLFLTLTINYPRITWFLSLYIRFTNTTIWYLFHIDCLKRL